MGLKVFAMNPFVALKRWYARTNRRRYTVREGILSFSIALVIVWLGTIVAQKAWERQKVRARAKSATRSSVSISTNLEAPRK